MIMYDNNFKQSILCKNNQHQRCIEKTHARKIIMPRMIFY